MQWFSDIILTLIILLPLVGSVALAVIRKEKTTIIKKTALIFSFTVFLLSVVLFILFDGNEPGFQFSFSAVWITAWGASYHVAVDGISLLLVTLTAFIVPLAIGFCKHDVQSRVKGFLIAVLMLETGVLGVFCARDMLLFYVFWEVMLIPLYFLIGLWGGEDRIKATVKFFIYTIAGSLLMLTAILYMYFQTSPVINGETILSAHSYAIDAFGSLSLPIPVQRWLFAAFTLAFLIKAPVFPFHTWQPLAYVQAPLGVTILLAALLAKTAIYGLMRFSVPFFPIIIYEWSPYLMGLAAVSVAFGAMVALVQKQMKSLIAYASLSHMGMIALGVFAMTSQSWQGSVIQMISHGVTITGLFLMIGFLFNRKPANDIDLFGGLWKLMPLFGAMFMILSLSMIGLPGTNGFIGEFLILIGTFNSSFATSAIWTIVAMTSVILGAVYMLRMFQRMMMGPLNNPEPERMPDLTKREIGLLIPLILFIFWIGLYPKTFTAKTEKTVQSVMIRTHKLIEEYKIKNKVKQIKQPQKSLF